MTTSSVQPVSYEWSNNTSVGISAQEIGTIDTSLLGNVTISGGTGSSYYYNTGAGGAGNTITISNGGYATGSSGTISIGAGLTATTISSLTAEQIASFTYQMPVEWKDKFPDWDKVQKMCEEYPGLKIAFEKFQTIYKLVVDHYDTPEDKRPKP
jgi:lipoprotein-anchoring transpeptidase ErfK/SrfK